MSDVTVFSSIARAVRQGLAHAEIGDGRAVGKYSLSGLPKNWYIIVMDAVGQLNAEFETLGEATVAERLDANHYQGAARAVALRWLNDKACARVGIDRPAHGQPIDLSFERLSRAENVGRLAILCAVVSLLAAAGSLGLSVQTLQAVNALRLGVAAPPAAPAAFQKR